MDISAREHAKKQWNKTACGQLEGDRSTKEYFEQVEKSRYKEQSWVHDYVNFNDFKNKKILEIGLGQGTDLLQFAKAGAQCHGIDITENHLNLTHLNLELHGFQADLKVCDAIHIDHEDNYFDCVYSFGVLHHIPEIEKCISEIKRVLKPGGTFLFVVYNKWSAFHLFYKLLNQGLFEKKLFELGYDGLISTIERGSDGINIKPYVKLYSKNEVKNLINKFNFIIKDVSVHQLYYTHFPDWFRIKPTTNLKKFERSLGWYIACKAIKKGECY